MDKDMACVHTHTRMHTLEYYSTMKKNGLLPFETRWMDLEGVRINELSQRKIPYYFTHIWNLGNKMHEQTKKETRKTNKKTKPNRENKLVVARVR